MLVEFLLPVLYTLIFLSLLFLALHQAYLRLRIDFQTKKSMTMDEAHKQGLPRFYFCAIMQAIYKTTGTFHPALPGEGMVHLDKHGLKLRAGVLSVFHPSQSERMLVTNCTMLHDKLALYKEAIQYRGDPDQIPPCFMSSFFNKPIIALGSSQFSRIRVLGIVHMSQEITVYQDLRPLISSKFCLSLVAEEYRRTERGLEVDIRTAVRDDKGFLLWDSKMTGLSLLKVTHRQPRSQPHKPPSTTEVYGEEMITTSKDTGLRFAHATLDWQPQHLTSFTAKLLGFSSPIAHGMWTMAVAVDRIMSHEKCFENAYPLHMKVNFKKPLTLPGHGLLQYDKPDGNSNFTRFAVVNPQTFVPILHGHMYTGEEIRD